MHYTLDFMKNKGKNVLDRTIGSYDSSGLQCHIGQPYLHFGRTIHDMLYEIKLPEVQWKMCINKG